jgi:hypothetical protein
MPILVIKLIRIINRLKRLIPNTFRAPFPGKKEYYECREGLSAWLPSWDGLALSLPLSAVLVRSILTDLLALSKKPFRPRILSWTAGEVPSRDMVILRTPLSINFSASTSSRAYPFVRNSTQNPFRVAWFSIASTSFRVSVSPPVSETKTGPSQCRSSLKALPHSFAVNSWRLFSSL